MSTDAISPLRQRMIEDMSARKLNPHTQRIHISSCKRFAAYLKRSPDTATADEIRLFQLRGFLYPLSDDRYWLFAVQSLDGVGAGLYGALFPLIVADLTRGTGHFNLAQGAVITAQGIGAALSTSLAELIVVHADYSAAFLVLAGIAASGFLLYFFGMPETRDLAERKPDQIATAVQTR